MHKLESTHFTCRKCNIAKVIQARGEVIHGPVCLECRKPMRKGTHSVRIGIIPKRKTTEKDWRTCG